MRKLRVVLDLAEWINLAGAPTGTRSTRWLLLDRRPRQRPAPARER
jgi:hypothetical protein